MKGIGEGSGETENLRVSSSKKLISSCAEGAPRDGAPSEEFLGDCVGRIEGLAPSFMSGGAPLYRSPFSSSFQSSNSGSVINGDFYFLMSFFFPNLLLKGI